MPATTVWFKGPGDPLSNLHKGNLFVFGRWFNCAEQAYQFARLWHANKRVAAEKVYGCSNGWSVMAEAKKHPYGERWNCLREGVMLEVLLAKARYDSAYAEKLCRQPTTEMVDFRENTLHPFWGGVQGKNRLGKLHRVVRLHVMNWREYLKAHQNQYRFGLSYIPNAFPRDYVLLDQTASVTNHELLTVPDY